MDTFLITNLRKYSFIPGDKNSTRPLIITSEIQKGQAILPKTLVL